MGVWKASKYRVPLSFVVSVGIMLVAKPTFLSFLAGLPIALVGISLRTWSSGYIRKNKELAIAGPFAFTRNPLYLGNLMIGLGFTVMVNRLWLVGFFLLFFGIVYRALILEEETALKAKFGESYLDYLIKVPRFFPKRSGSLVQGEFKWELVMKHQEYYAWLGTLLGMAWMLWRLLQ